MGSPGGRVCRPIGSSGTKLRLTSAVSHQAPNTFNKQSTVSSHFLPPILGSGARVGQGEKRPLGITFHRAGMEHSRKRRKGPSEPRTALLARGWLPVGTEAETCGWGPAPPLAGQWGAAQVHTSREAREFSFSLQVLTTTPHQLLTDCVCPKLIEACPMKSNDCRLL